MNHSPPGKYLKYHHPIENVLIHDVESYLRGFTLVLPKTFPWLSLGLLFTSYSTFSWVLYNATANWLTWALVIAFALIQALLLTTFADGLKSVIDVWLQSDLGYFTSVIVGAFLLAVALVWVNALGYILVLFACEILARLDLQNFGCNRLQAFLLLTTISLLGLLTGQAMNRVI